MIVLGIDPGMAETGYGVIAVEGSRLEAVDHGVIATSAGALEPPARRIYAEAELIERHQPHVGRARGPLRRRNPRTILSVGQARGAVLDRLRARGLRRQGIRRPR